MDRAWKRPSPFSSKETQKLNNQAAKKLGIKGGSLVSFGGVFNPKSKYAEAGRLVSGYKESKQSPLFQAIAKSMGIKSYDSINDYVQLRDLLSNPRPAAAAPIKPVATEPTIKPAVKPYTPTPLVQQPVDDNTSTAPAPAPEPAPLQFMPGGMGSSVDGGATGFRRKKSSARAAGLTTKGPGRLRINPVSTGSSGLNIGM